ncbi:MAG: hypothetical protein KJ893_04955 [Candidatus Omnitrophica bacterium]|nr:hypothetical protein [Candidatus Omnitrophota bacterium]MBU4477659.1 hypothetical protein [Candidatus Omnitrophota bacterium]MCG2703150.1 hypothetical protein [Candidatus Omnitrophota bacterium]
MRKERRLKCPVCGECFELEDDLNVGDTACCLDCDHELKIIKLDPPKAKALEEYPEVYNEGHNSRRLCSSYKKLNQGDDAADDDDDCDEEEEEAYSEVYDEDNDGLYRDYV